MLIRAIHDAPCAPAPIEKKASFVTEGVPARLSAGIHRAQSKFGTGSKEQAIVGRGGAAKECM